MQQWVYTCTSLYSIDGGSYTHFLNTYGMEGYELCSERREGNFIFFTFRKPIGPNWKERCEAAEAVINATNEADGIIAADIWEQIKNKHNAQEKRTNP